MSPNVVELQRMTALDLKSTREFLGFSTAELAQILDVRSDTLRKWEAGREPIPYRIAQEIEEHVLFTAAEVADLVLQLRELENPGVVVYRTDAQWFGAHGDPALEHLPARWWRLVVARAKTQVPTLRIGTRDELASAHFSGPAGPVITSPGRAGAPGLSSVGVASPPV